MSDLRRRSASSPISSARARGRKSGAGLPVGAATFGGIGLLLLALAAVWGASSRQFLASAAPADGVVVRLEAHRTKDNKRRVSVTYAPVVRFRTAEGAEVEFTGLGSNPPDYEVKDRVPVLYPRRRPDRARIDSFQELWLGPICIAAFGALFAAVGLALWRARM